VVITQTVYQKDTLIMDNGLNPATTYNFKAYWMDGLVRKDSSDLVTVTTGDTTSHNFIWEIDTLGSSGSYLNDVAIINENDIWVVGNIETDSMQYNAAHWDGSEWELIDIYSNTLDLYSIQYFNENDIWVTDICSPIHWDGNEWTLYHLQNMGLDACAGNAIWGTSSNDMYFVGDNGSIVHYDGSEFVGIESEYEVRLLEIHGTPDGEYVFITGRDFFSPAYTVAYQINDGSVETLYYAESTYPDNDVDLGIFSSVYVLGDTAYFVTIQGLWKYNYLTSQSSINRVFNNYAYHSLVVQDLNDIFMLGGGGKYVHYNGYSWDFNNDLYDGNLNTLFTRGDFQGDIVVNPGHFNNIPGGMVAIGRR